MPRLSKKRSLKRKKLQRGSGYSFNASSGGTAYGGLMPGGIAPRRRKQRGSGQLRASPASMANPRQRGGRKLRKKSLQSKKNRKNRKSLKRESFLSTLNQMGGFIRDGSTQFFKILESAQP